MKGSAERLISGRFPADKREGREQRTVELFSMRTTLTTRTLRAWMSSAAMLALMSVPAGAQTNACDLNGSGTVTSADVDLAVSMALGSTPCSANIVGPGVCNVLVVQRVVNAIGGACVTGNGRSVDLTWTASTTPGVVGYHVYRGTTAGTYQQLTTTPVTGTRYTDGVVANGVTYFYVVRAVASGGTQSTDSNQATATIPAT